MQQTCLHFSMRTSKTTCKKNQKSANNAKSILETVQNVFKYCFSILQKKMANLPFLIIFNVLQNQHHMYLKNHIDRRGVVKAGNLYIVEFDFTYIGND